MPYLTYQLDLIKTVAIKAADEYYEEALDLRVRELRVLRLLNETPGLTATELKHKLVLDKTLLSKNLSYLEKRGLITRTPDAQDTRLHKISLTAEGRRVCRKSEQIGQRIEKQIFAQLSAQEWQQLGQLLDKAYASFQHWEAARSKA